ncbi:Hpt domain-containing protein [Aridibaculum aurantiacum]|uniref:Hpt domain-containing protein n=1 Tax=Aridibaculum aurantiacum TaxID=2810307 RepID=UPI001A96F27A|nr:Hpt domain-containing protein [Aridibaculum aurantiacum]
MISSLPLPNTDQKRPIAGTAVKKAGETIDLYDLGALHDMSGGNKEFILSLVKIYLDTIPANSAEMVHACMGGNWDMVSKLAHKLKSTIDMMRMTTITQDIRTIELDAKNQVNKEILPNLVNKVDEVLNAVAADLKQVFSL